MLTGDWRLEIIFADIQVLVHNWLALLALTDTRLQLGHQGVLQEVAQDGAGVQAVDDGALQAGLALSLEGTEGWRLGLAGRLAWKIFQISFIRKYFRLVLLENISD